MLHRPATRLPGRLDEHTADTVMSLVLLLSRLHGDNAEPAIPTTIAGKTLGLVGFDPDCTSVDKARFRGFGMRVLVHDAVGTDRVIAMQLGADISPSLGHLLAEADIVSLHGQPHDGVIIDAHRLNQMKPDAHLINAGSW